MFVINHQINEILYLNSNVYYFKGFYGYFKTPFFRTTKITITTFLNYLYGQPKMTELESLYLWNYCIIVSLLEGEVYFTYSVIKL